MNLNYQTFKVISTILDVCGVFFLIYMIGYATFLFISVILGSTHMYKKKRQNRLKSTLLQDHHVHVSIIVPAYNEEITVVDTVKSLLALDYRDYEIIVVNDGSKDDTEKVLREAFNMTKIEQPIKLIIKTQPAEAVFVTYEQKVPVTLITKKNGGKADALNVGINASNYPYFICMDADSALQYDSLSKIVRPVLENENVVAVGGTVRPSNSVEIEQGRIIKYRLPKNILACMQLLEYDRTFLAARILFDSYNGSLIISGAFGLFKKSVVLAAGGYDSKTVGEDMELVVKLHEFCVSNDVPYRICYATDAICWSQVPERLKDLKKQRKRWHIGLLQSMTKHRGIFMNAKYGPLSFISYLYFLFYELLSPAIEVFGVLTVVLSWVCKIVNIGFMIKFFLIYALYSSILTLTAFFTRIQTIDLSISFSDIMKAVALCFFEVSVLRFIMAFVRFRALFGYNKNKVSWGRIQRYKQNVK